MDNASKALIMAGAVMIAILIISLGVLLFNMAASHTENVQNELTQQEILGYNQKYSRFAGDNVTGSDAKSLILLIEQHNNDAEERDNYGTISISGISKAKDIDSSKRYDITMSSYDSIGIVTGVSISVSQ